MCGFTGPAINHPWLVAAFPLSFFCLIHILIFPVWQATTWQVVCRWGDTRKTQQPAHPQQSQGNPPCWDAGDLLRRGEGTCATGVCTASSPTPLNSAPPLISFAPSRTRKSSTECRLFPSMYQRDQLTADDVNKMDISCILYISPIL